MAQIGDQNEVTDPEGHHLTALFSLVAMSAFLVAARSWPVCWGNTCPPQNICTSFVPIGNPSLHVSAPLRLDRIGVVNTTNCDKLGPAQRWVRSIET